MDDVSAQGFSPVTIDDWRAKVGDPAADGIPVTHVEDGLDVPWLFTPADALGADPAGTPGTAPFVRGRAPGTVWEVRQEHTGPERQLMNAGILSDLEGGSTALTLRFDAAGRDGVDPAGDDFAELAGSDGACIYTVDDLEAVLHDVFLDLAPVALDAGASAREAAALLVALWRRRGHAPDSMSASLRIDPLGALAGRGNLHHEPEEALAVAARTVAETDGVFGPGVTVLAADTRAYADAGASAAQELGMLMATATAYLRACEAEGVDPARAAARLELTVSVGADQFLEIAKLRAARRMWSRILQASGVDERHSSSRLYARTSARMLAGVDPWVNMLRVTTATFAAAVGAADGVTVAPFDATRGTPSALGTRMARNTQLVLMDESNLARVGDPGGGSWYLEWLTDRLANLAWAELQAIEAEGGALEALRSGWLAERLAGTAARRADDIAHRRQVLTGVNSFTLLGEDGVPSAPAIDRADLARREAERLTARPAHDGDATTFDELVARAEAGAALHELTGSPATSRCTPLVPAPDSQAFEALRDRALELEPRPTILLACVGPIAKHNTSATWAKSFFEAGGIVARQTAQLTDAAQVAAAMGEEPTPLAVVCAVPDEDAELIAAITAALREAGAKRVYVVDADEEHLAAWGGDESVRDGVDMPAVLAAALDCIEENR